MRELLDPPAVCRKLQLLQLLPASLPQHHCYSPAARSARMRSRCNGVWSACGAYKVPSEAADHARHDFKRGGGTPERDGRAFDAAVERVQPQSHLRPLDLLAVEHL